MDPVRHVLSDRFEVAFGWANQLHRDQTRKATQTPYISHLMAVAGLAMEDAANDPDLAGETETIAIAALLHDSLEDTAATPEDIETRFGARVAEIVLGCSDTVEDPKPPWLDRKTAYLRHLESADQATLCVALADKRHNASSLVGDLRRVGPTLWDRFNAGADRQLWLYDRLVDVLCRRRPGHASDELAIVVSDLRLLIEPEAGWR